MKSFNSFNPLRNLLDKFSNKLLRRIVILITIDTISIIVAYIGAFLILYPIRSWKDLIEYTYPRIPAFLPEFLLIGIIVFAFSGMYRTLWRYASIDAVFVITRGTLFSVLIPVLFLAFTNRSLPHWTLFVIQWMILFLLISFGRFSIRLLNSSGSIFPQHSRKGILIYGAGDAGEMIARDILRNRNKQYNLAGFLDDDETKHHQSIHSVPIFGGKEVALRVVEKKNIDEIILAMPSIPGTQTRAIHEYLRNELDPRIVLKTVPGISELIDEKITFQHVRNVRIRDLLRRAPIELNSLRVKELITDKTVLVSGAGGSIGSELCRQICHHSPDIIIIIDISEASLYLIMEELESKFGDVKIVPIVGDICNQKFIESIFASYNPEIVFHAAAYKHVPLMEFNPWSALYNNVKGTRVLADVAAQFPVERFVMISTDKAVRPTSIMGATKRLCEMIVQVQNHHPDSIFSVVRFGNVMGSSGSVIPKFGRQIKAGGPITITDRRITRYFMLISEAVQLVMQSATLDDQECIYILDMGTPMKIVDLATDMIKLSGYTPNVDIKIEYTGLRPGEKLYEELYHSGMGDPTAIEKISLTHEPVPNPVETLAEIDKLIKSCYNLPRGQIYRKVANLVPDYTISKEDLSSELYSPITNHTIKKKVNVRNPD